VWNYAAPAAIELIPYKNCVGQRKWWHLLSVKLVVAKLALRHSLS